MVLVGAATSARTMTAPDVAAAVHAGLTTTADTTGLEDTLADAATNVSASCCAAVVFTDKFDSRLAWHEDIIVGFFLIIVGCQLYGFVCYVLGVATIISITALAVVRYLKTCTYTYSRMLTLQHMKLVLVAVYIYSLFWALLPLFQVISNYEVEPFGVSCTLNWANPSNSARVYILLVVMLVVALPSLVMIWCYTKILLLVHRNRRKKLIISKRSATSQGPSELQITLVSGLVCLGFLVAWMPYAVVSIMYGLMGKAAPVYASLAPVLLAKSSCAYNPIIYIFINARYRREMMGILQERLGPLLCCPPRQDHPHQHQDPPESTSLTMRVPRETNQTEEVSLAVLAETNGTPDLQTATDRPPLTSSHHHNHTLQDCRDAPHCVPGSSHDQTDGEGQSSEADEVPDQAAGWSLPSTGQLKSFSCDDIHPLYHFPDQKGHQRLSFTGSQGHQSAKPSNTEPQNIEEMVESVSVGGRSSKTCDGINACVSSRDEDESSSSSRDVQDINSDMISLP
ncbi:uncharacterized protein [Panulirus ornatus]|uniref:uncharacterized protein isoform X2 n=1 Tax=Panulirus ornatus TaxID=150431 RepID=UPI003A85FF67